MGSNMLHADQVEVLITLVSSLDKSSLVNQFGAYRASFPLDFTPEFLEHQPIERLRHLFVAICLQSQKMPQLEVAESIAAAN